MSGYVYGLICASLAIAVAQLLIPENAKTRPYLSLIFGLALLLAIVKPIGELVDLVPQINYDASQNATVTNQYEKIADNRLADAYRRAIETQLKTSFDLTDCHVGVIIGKERKPTQITVTLTGADVFRNPYIIEEQISSAFGCRCITVIG